MLVPLAGDKHPAVRASFCYGIGALAQEIDKTMAAHHAMHMPAVMALTRDPIPPVASRAVLAVDCLMDTESREDML